MQKRAGRGLKEKLTSRELRKETRRKEIIAAALQAFTAEGFTVTRLEDIAELADVSKGTIYLYFSSKEELFREVIRENVLPTRDRVLSLIDNASGSAEELLADALQQIYESFQKAHMPDLLALVIGEGKRFPDILAFFHAEMVSRNHESLRRIIRKGIEGGEFREESEHMFPQMIISPVLMAALWKLHFDRFSPIDFNLYAEQHLQMLLSSLRK